MCGLACSIDVWLACSIDVWPGMQHLRDGTDLMSARFVPLMNAQGDYIPEVYQTLP